MELNITRLVSGGIITNYSCSSKCAHCLYNCSPRRNKTYMDKGLAVKVFKSIRLLGCRSVHVGGGEPLLMPDGLFPVLDQAKAAGVGIDYVETNASWFSSAERARNILNELKERGVHTLLISISPFHNAHIPFEKVRRLIKSCQENEMNVFPWITDFINDITSMDESSKHSLEEYETLFGKDYLKSVSNRYWIHLGGRAISTFHRRLASKSVEEVLSDSSSNCSRELSDTSHFHIDLEGNYVTGLCVGLSIDYRDLGEPIDREKYQLLDLLFKGGIQRLFQYASDTFQFASQKQVYINKCDLCNEIRGFLISQKEIHFPELKPREYYSEMA